MLGNIMAKEYKDATPKEKYDSAKKMDKEDWSPKKALGDLATSALKKIMPEETKEPVPPTPPKGLKKGGSVKKCNCMARGGGIEVRGKTKGKFV